MGSQMCCAPQQQNHSSKNSIPFFQAEKAHHQYDQLQTSREDSSDPSNKNNRPEGNDNSHLPLLRQEISDILGIKKPFYNEFANIVNPKTIFYNGNIYRGEVRSLHGEQQEGENSGGLQRSPQKSQKYLPHGYGKFYKSDGSLILGNFIDGKPSGKIFNIKNDCTYYYGDIIDGKYSGDNGVYCSEDFQYNGGFRENKFQGHGKLVRRTSSTSSSNFSLQGQFEKGQIKQGHLIWFDNMVKYSYKGQFATYHVKQEQQQNRSIPNEIDSNSHSDCHNLFLKNLCQLKMQGTGSLKQQIGTYRGQFKNNKKHGEGTYSYRTGNRYVGSYVQNFKQGYGQLFNKFNEIIYEGQWYEDLPIIDGNDNNGDRAFDSKMVQEKLIMYRTSFEMIKMNSRKLSLMSSDNIPEKERTMATEQKLTSGAGMKQQKEDGEGGSNNVGGNLVGSPEENTYQKVIHLEKVQVEDQKQSSS